jgi:hypothetical protein
MPLECGRFRISLTYRDPARSPGGKTSRDTDTFQGRFIELVPDEKIVEAIEPAGIRLEDNEMGCKEALRKLAAFVE